MTVVRLGRMNAYRPPMARPRASSAGARSRGPTAPRSRPSPAGSAAPPTADAATCRLTIRVVPVVSVNSGKTGAAARPRSISPATASAPEPGPGTPRTAGHQRGAQRHAGDRRGQDAGRAETFGHRSQHDPAGAHHRPVGRDGDARGRGRQAPPGGQEQVAPDAGAGLDAGLDGGEGQRAESRGRRAPAGSPGAGPARTPGTRQPRRARASTPPRTASTSAITP